MQLGINAMLLLTSLALMAVALTALLLGLFGWP